MTQELALKDKQEVRERDRVSSGRTYIPAVDIWEDENGLILRADMPGVDPEHVSVEMNEDLLSVRGEISPDDYEGLTPAYTEYNVGNFERRFTVPNGGRFDREHITAKLANGVLEVVVPRSEQAKPRKIEITAG